MVSRKRAREEAEEDDPSVRVVVKRNEPLPSSSPQDGVEPGLLHQLRNMWEFSNLIQFIYSFGKAVKISEDIDIDVSDPQTVYFGPFYRYRQLCTRYWFTFFFPSILIIL